MKETPTPALTAGIAAGRVWASSNGEGWAAIGIAGDEERPSHKLNVARLRSWCTWLFEMDVWDYSTVYTCILTNKLVTDNTRKAGDNELFLAAEQAGFEALGFWRDVPGWPNDRNEWWSFVEGFVRGVADDETKP